MRKFLSCGLLAAFVIISTALQVCAEPPPAQPETIATQGTLPTECTEQCAANTEMK